MSLRGLTIIASDGDRLSLAVELALAHAALGGATRLFVTGAATAHIATLPFGDLRAMQVRVLICQSRAADCAIDLAQLPGVEGGGLISLLQTLDDDRLVTY